MRRLYFILIAALAAFGCSREDSVSIQVFPETVSTGYIGNGAEWDPYDEALSWGYEISEADWQKLYSRLDYMKPGYIRCMINASFLYYDLETGKYDKERNIESIHRLLKYCTDKGINVIYGEYNPPDWKMKDSQEWVDMSVDYLNYLVNGLGLDCIKYFVIFNEPDGDWASPNGDYDLWLSMARKFKAGIDSYPGLGEKVSLAAPDVVLNYHNHVSKYDAEGWVAKTAEDMGKDVGVFDVHSYPGRNMVLGGKYRSLLTSMKSNVPEGQKILLGESGYKYDSDPADSLLWKEYHRRCEGHPFTKGSDCNMFVYDDFYALDMPFLAMEAMNCGFSGVAAWMLDDAMHSNGDTGTPNDIKIWGMWNIAGEEVFGDASQEELRPWYYTWSLVCRHFPSGADILKVEYPERYGFSAAAAVKDGKMTFAAANCTDKAIDAKLTLPQGFENAVLYLYKDGGIELDSDGHPVPVKTGLNGKSLRLQVPANSFLLVSDMEIN